MSEKQGASFPTDEYIKLPIWKDGKETGDAVEIPLNLLQKATSALSTASLDMKRDPKTQCSICHMDGRRCWHNA